MMPSLISRRSPTFQGAMIGQVSFSWPSARSSFSQETGFDAACKVLSCLEKVKPLDLWKPFDLYSSTLREGFIWPCRVWCQAFTWGLTWDTGWSWGSYCWQQEGFYHIHKKGFAFCVFALSMRKNSSFFEAHIRSQSSFQNCCCTSPFLSTSLIGCIYESPFCPQAIETIYESPGLSGSE